MNEFDDLKQIIDENLEDIQVTNQLKRKTLKVIFKDETRFFDSLKRNWMKTATVFSVFVVTLTLGINSFINNNNPDQITPLTNTKSITECPSQNSSEFDGASQDESTRDDTCQINP